MNLSWLNPISWVKNGIAAKCDSEIDKHLTAEALTKFGKEKVNYLIQLKQSKSDREEMKRISNDLIYGGESLIDLGKALDPDGDNGAQFSDAETLTLNARVQVLFGDIIKDWELAEWREKLKKLIREKLGVS